MSFKILFASTFGLIKSTAKIESAHEALLSDYHEYGEFLKSEELKEYHKLDLLVNSDTFKQKKKEIQQLSLKGSKEEVLLHELKNLSKNGRLKKFYATLNSDGLKKFEKISDSEILIKYKELKTAVEHHSFEALKKKDKESKEYAIFNEYLNLKSSDEVQFFKKFRQSSAFRNYELMSDSTERKRLEELQKITASVEFLARVGYLEDKHKWEKTEDSEMEKRFAELKKLPQLIKYLKYRHSTDFDFLKKWHLVFEDRFDTNQLDTQKWVTKSYRANESLGQNYSQPGDLHAFTDGKNVLADGKSLKIEVRKEKATGMQWRIPFGFVEQEFDYTSGIVSNAATEWWKHGILEAKVKYSPDNHLVDAIYLLGEDNSPQINLVEIGAKNRVGLFTNSDHGIHAESTSISGLKTGEFYIFRLEWSAHSLVWKINDRIVWTVTDHVPAFKMHLNAASIVVAEPTNGLPHRFEIDWVRFYQHAKV
ncbi:MAG: glycoside hydrolase family 16 protein [Bacteroidia bacterium]